MTLDDDTIFHLYQKPRHAWMLLTLARVVAWITGSKFEGSFQRAPVYRLHRKSILAVIMRAAKHSGITIGHGIFYEPDLWGSKPATQRPVRFHEFLAHERKHVDQWGVWVLAFVPRYFGEGLWLWIKMRRGRREAYRAISFEREARATARRPRRPRSSWAYSR